MKKLKKFVLNDARLLSRDEMATIEGSILIDLVDHCTEDTYGQRCVYLVGKEYDHSFIMIGKCIIRYEWEGDDIVAKGVCV